MSSVFDWPTATFRAGTVVRSASDEAAVSDRPDRLPGFSTAKLAQTTALLVGAGGLNCWVALGLARKGIGALRICDGDLVEASNLNRQFFSRDDLFQSKAVCLARNAAANSWLGSSCTGFECDFDEDSAGMLSDRVDVAVVGVDGNPARALASRHFRKCGIPAVFLGVSEDAEYRWTFIQGRDGPCVGCVFPRVAAALGTRQPCRDVPAVLDCLLESAGAALRAVDAIVMGRAICWNFDAFHLADSVGGWRATVTQRTGCKLCGHGS